MDWVRHFDVPSRGEIQARLDAARSPRARRSVRPETIQLVLAARQMRSMGYSVATVALATSDSLELGLDRQGVSTDQAARELQALEQSVKRAERALRRLEAAEGISPPPPPDDRDAQKRSSDAYRAGLALRHEHERLLRRLDDPAHPACLIAHALVLEHKATTWHTHVPPLLPNGRARRDDRDELRRLAAELKSRAEIVAETMPTKRARPRARSSTPGGSRLA